MIAVIQRVKSSSVHVYQKEIGKIGKGLNILLGIQKEDSYEEADKLINKIINLRIFADENEKMNLSLLDVNGSVLVISQFTLLGSVLKGRRPSFDKSAEPKLAEELYEYFVQTLKNKNINVETGIFGAMMEVSIINDGPVTFVIDSKTLHSLVES
jgi:D-tyrosyl-tRNA(Tyr) deacylase